MSTLRSLTQTCIACPSQWDGVMQTGAEVYVRFRWGVLSMTINGVRTYEKQLSGSLDGFMTTEEMLQILNKYIEVDQNTDIDVIST